MCSLILKSFIITGLMLFENFGNKTSSTVDILISKNQALQMLYIKHHVFVSSCVGRSKATASATNRLLPG